MTKSMIVPTIEFKKGAIDLIDQTRLPAEYKIVSVKTIDQLCELIITLAIRGAPALGVARAYGIMLAVEEKWGTDEHYFFDQDSSNLAGFPEGASTDEVKRTLLEAADTLFTWRVRVTDVVSGVHAFVEARLE